MINLASVLLAASSLLVSAADAKGKHPISFWFGCSLDVGIWS